jgi:chemotaxis response regulator CheB
MPRQAIAIGAAQEILPLGDMARRLKELCSHPATGI